MKVTIDEYSKRFKMSKEMINSRLKAKRLNYIIEGGVTYIDIPDDKPPVQTTITHSTAQQNKLTPPAKQRPTVATVLALYQRENSQLKEKIVQLEAKIDKLIDDKEQMLRDEIKKIEQVYSQKDDQLKTILELVNAKLMMESNAQTHIHEIESTPSDIPLNDTPKIIELQEYIKSLGMKSHERKVIKKRFLNVYDNDIRIIKQNGKLYLDFSKYDYSDLLNL